MLVQTAFQLRQNAPKPSRNSRGDVAEMLEDIANSIHGWSAGSKKRLEDAMDELSFYDYHQVCTSLMLLKVEIGLGGANSRGTRWHPFYSLTECFSILSFVFFPGSWILYLHWVSPSQLPRSYIVTWPWCRRQDHGTHYYIHSIDIRVCMYCIWYIHVSFGSCLNLCSNPTAEGSF